MRESLSQCDSACAFVCIFCAVDKLLDYTMAPGRTVLMVGAVLLAAAGSGNALNVRSPQELPVYNSPYVAKDVGRFYPEKMLDLLNSTAHVKDMQSVEDSRPIARAELNKILGEETNETTRLFSESMEQTVGLKDKLDKSFETFEKKAEYQAKNLVARSRYAKIAMHSTFNTIQSIAKHGLRGTAPKVTTNGTLSKKDKLLKSVPKKQKSELDLLATETDKKHGEMLGSISVVAKEWEHGEKLRPKEAFARQRYKVMVKKLANLVAVLKPAFVNSTEPIKGEQVKTPTNESKPVAVGKMVDGLESSMETLGAVREDMLDSAIAKVKK